MDAELEVTELLEGTEAYDAYVQKAAEKLDTKPEYLAYAHAFDIKLVEPHENWTAIYLSADMRRVVSGQDFSKSRTELLL